MSALPSREWLTEADIVRAAKVIIDLRGRYAAAYALHRAGELRLTHASEAEAIWRRIVKAIERLQSS